MEEAARKAAAHLQDEAGPATGEEQGGTGDRRGSERGESTSGQETEDEPRGRGGGLRFFFFKTMYTTHIYYPVYRTRTTTYQRFYSKTTDCTADGLISNI